MKTLYTITLLVLISLLGYSQAPEAFNYQAVIRNASGDILANSQITVQISILQDSESGSAVYVETFNPTTNDYGLIAIKLGKGTIQSGTFIAIDWGAHAYYVKIEIDPNNGTDYTHMGTSQLLAVPYALYSTSAANVFSGDYNDLANAPTAVSAFSNDVGYLTSFTETDPIFGVHAASGIATGDITNWNSAYGWGDHGTEGYITDGNTNWDNSYGFITQSSTITGLIRSTASGDSYITGGNLGLGTTNPAMRLHVHESSGNSTIRLSNSSGTANNILQFYEGATRQASITVRGSGIPGGPPNAMNIYTSVSGAPITLGTNSGETMRIQDGGRVGIGTTDIDYKLCVGDISDANNYLRIQSNNWGGAMFFDGEGSHSGGIMYYHGTDRMTFQVRVPGGNPYERMRITTDGSVRIWDGSGSVGFATGAGSLYVEGVLEVDGWTYSTGYTTTSDKRWKKDIVPVEDALSKILNLNGVNFYWKTDEYPGEGFTEEKQIGFIAQEVEQVLPELVRSDQNNHKGVSYDKITAVLVEAIKEQQQMIEELKQEVQELKNQQLVVINQ